MTAASRWPRWLWFLLILMFIPATIGVWGYFNRCENLPEAMTLVVLTLTLMAIIVYTYYNYLIVSDIYIPVATFDILPKTNNNLYLIATLRNHSKQPIQAQFTPRITTSLQQEALAHPFPTTPLVIKPLDEFSVELSIGKILASRKFSTDEYERDNREHADAYALLMKATVVEHPEQTATLLRFQITIQYSGLKTGIQGEPIVKDCYFDFNDLKLRE